MFVDQETACANGASLPPAWFRRFLPLLLLAVAACSDPSGPGAPASLHDVPAPHAPPDTMTERAAIERGLQRDGARASREAAALRSRTGKAALPPPPEPVLAPEPATPGQPAAAALLPPNLEAEIALDRVRSEKDDVSLNAFLRQLVRRQPDRAVTRSVLTTGDEPQPSAVPRPTRNHGPAQTPLLDRALEPLGIRPGTPAAASAAAIDGRSVTEVHDEIGPRLVIAFAGGGSEIAAIETGQIARLAGRAAATGERVLVVGHGDNEQLAMLRARAVAQTLIRYGLPAQALILRPGGLGDAVMLVSNAATS